MEEAKTDENNNTQSFETNETLTTDDLVFLVGEKTIELLQKNKVIDQLKIQLFAAQKNKDQLKDSNSQITDQTKEKEYKQEIKDLKFKVENLTQNNQNLNTQINNSTLKINELTKKLEEYEN